MVRRYLAVFLALSVIFACGKIEPAGGNDTEKEEQEQGGGSGEGTGEEGEDEGDEGGGQGGGQQNDAIYTIVTSAPSDWSGDYLITYKSSPVLYVFADWSESAYGQSAADIAPLETSDGIPAADVDKYKSVIKSVSGGYSIWVSGVGYIGYSGSGNILQHADEFDGTDNYTWTLSYARTAKLHPKSASETSRYLQYNTSAPRFACYKTALQDVTLYRRSEPGDDSGSGSGGGGGESGGNEDDHGGSGDDSGDDSGDEGGGDGGEENPPAKVGTLNYYEVPVMNDADHNGIDDKDNTLYYAHHQFNMSSRRYRNYTICYSGDHHCPVWVAAPRHSIYEGSSGRSDAYGRDPDIPSGIQYGSKDTGGGCNKGHMLGSKERTCCSDANRQVFYYTNIAPQLSSGFNTGGGGWNLLEDWVDTRVCSDTLYVVIGCYFDTFTDGYGNTVSPKTISFGGRSDVDMPTMFYYILLRTKSGATRKALKDCSTSDLICAAFVRAHTNALKGQKPSSREMMSVADLEKITGFTYFPNVPQAPKSTFSASDWGL